MRSSPGTVGKYSSLGQRRYRDALQDSILPTNQLRLYISFAPLTVTMGKPLSPDRPCELLHEARSFSSNHDDVLRQFQDVRRTLPTNQCIGASPMALVMGEERCMSVA